MNKAKRLYRLVNELKRRKIFISMIITNTGVQVSWWNGCKVVTGEESDAWQHIDRMWREERRELEWPEHMKARRMLCSCGHTAG